MSSNEQNQYFGLYRQQLDNSPPALDPALFLALQPVYEELRRILTYTGLVRPDKERGYDEVAGLAISGKVLPVPGLWLNEGLGQDPGTPLYLDSANNVLTPNYKNIGDTAIFVGIVDVDNHVVCTGIRRIPIK